MALRLVLAEDNLLVREGLEQLLAGADGLEVVDTCADRDSLLTSIAEQRPDVVVTDIRMPPTRTDEGIQVAEQLRETHPDVGVVVLSQYSELSTAVRTVAEGGSVIDPKLVEVLVSGRAALEQSPLRDLTAREREVLSEIAEGKSNAAIAESLVLTKRAVEKHINSIFMKLGLADAHDVSKRVKATLLFLADTSPRE
jgi:DNA-binding NarL/FixJ family response regulator